MAETLSTISIISFLLATICLTLAVVLFIRFKIPAVIGDLSGKTARRSIRQMHEVSEQNGKREVYHDKTNRKNKNVRNLKRQVNSIKAQPETGLLMESAASKRKVVETELLVDEDETTILRDENETTLLEENAALNTLCGGGMKIELLEEIIMIHSEEIII